MAYPHGDHGEPPPGVVISRPGRYRSLGPVLALCVPLALMVLGALVILAWPCDGRSCVEPSLGGWLLVLFALPTAIASGLPWWVTPINVTIALATSAVAWMVFGAIAGRRTARNEGAGWGTFAIELATLTGGVVLGQLLGFALIGLWLRF